MLSHVPINTRDDGACCVENEVIGPHRGRGPARRVAGVGEPYSIRVEFFSYISSPGISWMDAQTFASSLSYNGASGYLAVITSSAENSFLTSNFTISSTSFEGAWLGGQCNASNACFWETGPLAGQQFSQGQTSVNGAYVNFGGIEPNNPPSAIYLNIGYSGYAGIANGQWADALGGVTTNGFDPVQGYLVEFSVAPCARCAFAVPGPVAGAGLPGMLFAGIPS